MKNHSFKGLWPGLGHIVIHEPLRAPARRTVGLSGHGVSPLGLLGGEVVGGVPGEAENARLEKTAESMPLMAPYTTVGSEVHWREGFTGQGLYPQVCLSHLLMSYWPKQVTHLSLVSKGGHCEVTLRGYGEREKEELRVTFAKYVRCPLIKSSFPSVRVGLSRSWAENLDDAVLYPTLREKVDQGVTLSPVSGSLSV